LTIITLGEALHKVTNGRVAKANVKQTPSFTIDSCPNTEREMKEKEKTLSLGFNEASDTFRV
jgi:hypothetical protein